MATRNLLCIHRDPLQLGLLLEHGYELTIAASAVDGMLRIASQPVDAVIVEHGLPSLDGAAIASEIKRIQPEMPIIMLADHIEIPASALKSVDALVIKTDGPHFLLATVHFILNARPTQRRQPLLRSKTRSHSMQTRNSLLTTELTTPFSQMIWQRIKSGDLAF